MHVYLQPVVAVNDLKMYIAFRIRYFRLSNNVLYSPLFSFILDRGGADYALEVFGVVRGLKPTKQRALREASMRKHTDRLPYITHTIRRLDVQG